MTGFTRWLLVLGLPIALSGAAGCSSNGTKSSPDGSAPPQADAAPVVTVDVGAPTPDQGALAPDQGEEFSLEPSAPAQLSGGGDPVPAGSPIFPETDSGKLLNAFLRAAVAAGDSAQSDYAAAMAELRAGNLYEMVDLVLDAYDKTDPEAYFVRFLLIATVGRLPTSKAADWLDSLAKQPLPTAQTQPQFAQHDPVGEELTLRLAAIKSLGHLARFEQDPKVVMAAGQTAVELIQTSAHLAIQVAAVEAFLEPAMPEGPLYNPATLQNSQVFLARRAELLQRLDQKFHHLVALESAADLLGVPEADGPAKPHVHNSAPPVAK